jgi:hypothetical protein
MSSVTPVAASQRSAESDHRWLILVIVAIAQLMVVLDATVVNIASRCWMRLSRFPMIAASWSTVLAARLPRPFFMFAQAPSSGSSSGARPGPARSPCRTL